MQNSIYLWDKFSRGVSGLVVNPRVIGGFSPAVLFANNEPGVWYDPSQAANLDWRRNLLTFTEQFDNAAWQKLNATINAAGELTDTATDAQHYIRQDLAKPAAAIQYSTFFDVKAGSKGFCYLQAQEGGNFCRQYFNLSTGIVGTGLSSGLTLNSAAVEDLGDGVYRCKITFTSGTATTLLLLCVAADADNDAAYAGSGDVAITIRKSQLEEGSTATEYQRITDVNTEVRERFPQATLFQDTAGTTPVTTPGQTVGLMLDKSKGLTLGPELVTPSISDPLWEQLPGVPLSTVVGDQLTFGGQFSGRRYRVNLTSPTSRYEFRFNARRISGNSTISFFHEGSPTGNQTALTLTDTMTSYVVRPQGSASGGLISFGFQDRAASNFGTIEVTDISVKELPGFHATQATAAARPTYGIVPAGGRRNFLERTEEFDNAVWVVSNIGAGTVTKSTSNAGAAPDGTTTADRVIFNLNGGTTTSDIALIRQANATVGSLTHSVYLRSFDGVSSYVMQIIEPNGNAANITVTGSWQRFEVSGTSVATVNYGVRLRGGLSPANSDTADVLIWGAQLEEGSTATAYQKVTTQFDVTEAGVESLGKLFFDGVDDIMISPSAIFYGSASSMILGAETFAGTGKRTIASDSGSVGLQFATTQVFGFVNNFTTGSGGIQLNQAYPNGRVVSWLRGQSQNSALLRVDGSPAFSTTHNQADNVSRPLTVGARVGADFGAMHFYSLVHIARFIDETELSNTEAYVAGKTAGVEL